MTSEDALKLTAMPRHGYLQVTVAGDIDIASAGDLNVFLARHLRTAAASGGLVVDLSEVSFIDARGLSGLLRARYLAADLQISFALVDPAPCVSRLLKLTGLRRHFTVAPSGPGQVLQPAGTPAESAISTPPPWASAGSSRARPGSGYSIEPAVPAGTGPDSVTTIRDSATTTRH